MSEYRVECLICGESFLAASKNEKYCSAFCRAAGARKTRKEWEQTSGYKVKQRQRMREQRKADRTALQRRKQMQQTRSLEDSKKTAAARKKKRIENIHNKASQGDMHALQEIALESGNVLEYWRLYKEQILKSEKEFHCRGRHVVGGIEIHENDFEHRIVEQLETEKRKR